MSKLAVGVDFGGTKMLGALVDPGGQIIAEKRVSTPHEGEVLLDAMAALVRSLEARATGPVIGVGVGAAGLVDRKGVLHYGPNVGGVTQVPIRAGLQHRLSGQRVEVDNDATAATWGECLVGAGVGVREMALVTLGTGIGGGIVVDGRLFRGEQGFAAEVGHMTIVADGVRCACGKAGCWESYASGSALGRLARDAAAHGRVGQITELVGAIDDIRGEHVTDAAREGDPEAQAVLRDFARWVAVGIANLIAILDPQVVVLGGGMAEDLDLLLDDLRRDLDSLVFGASQRPKVPVIPATLGEHAGVIGAAMLVHADEVPEVLIDPSTALST